MGGGEVTSPNGRTSPQALRLLTTINNEYPETSSETKRIQQVLSFRSNRFYFTSFCTYNLLQTFTLYTLICHSDFWLFTHIR